MKIASAVRDRKLYLYLSGELDQHAAGDTMRQIEEKIETELPQALILDLSEVTFMDSSGIAVILKAYRRMQAVDGRIWLENVPTQPMRVLEASGIERLIEITEGGKIHKGRRKTGSGSNSRRIRQTRVLREGPFRASRRSSIRHWTSSAT